MFPPRPREALDEPVAYRVCSNGQHNWEGTGRTLGRQACARTVNDQHIDLEAQQLGHQVGHVLVPRIRPAVFQKDVLGVDVAEFPEALPERVEPAFVLGFRRTR